MSLTLQIKKTYQAAQADNLLCEGSLWASARNGALEHIKEVFPGPCSRDSHVGCSALSLCPECGAKADVYERGPVGENIVHIASLTNTPQSLEVADYLIELYGCHLADTPYQLRTRPDDEPSLYEGETFLHIAIVNARGSTERVKRLLDLGVDVQARAWGPFFTAGSAGVDLGEYPLSFASSLGKTDVLRLLIDAGGILDAVDSRGRCALHMAVQHNRPESYDVLADAGADEGIRDFEGKTPLLYAAKLGRREMISHILQRRRKVLWSYGPVICYRMLLTELDTVGNSGQVERGLLHALIWHCHGNILLREGILRTILQQLAGLMCRIMISEAAFSMTECVPSQKWEGVVKTGFQVMASLFILVVAFVSLSALLHWTSDWNSGLRLAADYTAFAVALLMLYFQAVEVYTEVQATVDEVVSSRALSALVERARPPLYYIPRAEVARDDEAPGSRHFSVGRVIKAAFSHNRATRARKSSRLRSMTTSNSNPALDASSVRQRCSGSDREGEECVTGTDVRSPQDDLGQAQPVPLAVSQGASIGAFGRIRGPVGESMDADWGGHEGDSSGRGNDLSGHGREEAEEDGGEEGGEEGEEEGGEEGGEDSDREDERLRRMRMAMARGMFAGNGRSLLRSERVSFRVENDGRVAGWRRGSSASSGEMEGRPKEDHVGRFIAMQRSAMPLSLRVRLYIYAFREWMKSVDAVHGCMLLFLVLVVAHGALLALYVRSSGDAPSSSDGVPAIDAAVVGLASLSGWVSLLYFGRASRRWGHLVVIAIECVGDILRFAGIFLLFLLGFSFAFVVLVSPRSDLAELRAAKAMQYYGTRMWAVFTAAWTSDVGAWDADLATHDPEHQWLGYALIVLFGAMIILLLFNIIIAMMASTFARVQEMSEETWHLQWARLLIQTERRLPRALRLRAKVGALSPEGHVFDYEDFEEIQGHQASPQCKGPRGIEGLKARRTTS